MRLRCWGAYGEQLAPKVHLMMTLQLQDSNWSPLRITYVLDQVVPGLELLLSDVMGGVGIP